MQKWCGLEGKGQPQLTDGLSSVAAFAMAAGASPTAYNPWGVYPVYKGNSESGYGNNNYGYNNYGYNNYGYNNYGNNNYGYNNYGYSSGGYNGYSSSSSSGSSGYGSSGYGSSSSSSFNNGGYYGGLSPTGFTTSGVEVDYVWVPGGTGTNNFKVTGYNYGSSTQSWASGGQAVFAPSGYGNTYSGGSTMFAPSSGLASQGNLGR
jgi:hypothetical protein